MPEGLPFRTLCGEQEALLKLSIGPDFGLQPGFFCHSLQRIKYAAFLMLVFRVCQDCVTPRGRALATDAANCSAMTFAAVTLLAAAAGGSRAALTPNSDDSQHPGTSHVPRGSEWRVESVARVAKQNRPLPSGKTA